MSSHPPAPSPNSPPPGPLRIYTVVLGIGVFCAITIVTVYEATRPLIATNRSALRERAVLEVLPKASRIEAFGFDESQATFRLQNKQPNEEMTEELTLYAGFTPQDELVGVAIEAAGMGYQDTIRLLYGYSFADQAIVGLFVLESRETPGLGDRIETDSTFLANFKRLELSTNEDGTKVAHPIEFVKAGGKTKPWQIDGITGATVSSRAVAEILRESTQRWIPLLQQRETEFALQMKASRTQ